MNTICHISSAHYRNDTRIFLKEAVSLSKAGFKTSFIVLDGMEDETKEGVKIINANLSKKKLSIFKRLFIGSFLIYKKLKFLKPKVVHFHDPELILLGIFLKLKKYKVIYDIHENTAHQILSKRKIPKIFRSSISIAFRLFEKFSVRFFDFLIYATPGIEENFSPRNSNTKVINNFPIIGDLDKPVKSKNKFDEVVFLGGINSIRGIEALVKSLEYAKVKLNLVGNFLEKNLKKKLQSLDGWQYVNYHGFCEREKSSKIISRSSAGLVTFHEAPNHMRSQPNKLFEYMCCGIPVIASYFPLWKLIVENNKCGICVNPNNPREIARAINFIQKNPKKAMLMGKNGREAVLKKYNWVFEEKKLIELYKKLLSL